MAPPATKRNLVEAWIEQHHPLVIGEAEWSALIGISGASPGYLRKLLRESGVALHPMVDGVRQEDFDSLEHSLLALLDEYEAGDAIRKRAVRALVIEAKDHARFAMRNPEKRDVKQEMVDWMIQWLENPGLFSTWVKLRRRVMAGDAE